MDIIAPDTTVWQYIENTARQVAHRFGFGEIRTPSFEDLGLFRRGVGETTDVVQKEMYTFEDREGRIFALRPEGTASVARAVIENGRQSDPLPLRYFYLINCFRYEKPQAGRSREFYQFGAEMFGAAGAGADFTMISFADTFIKELGISGAELHINSIGCSKCRPAYREALVAYLKANEEKLCSTCKSRLEQNPLRILDCKNESCSRVAEGAPKTVDYLCGECSEHLEMLKGYLSSVGIYYEIDPRIVRGLDYYTRTVFEFIVPGIGAQSTICGGGRYDGLMEELGGSPMPGIGFAMGITRLILAMEQCGAMIPETDKPELYVASMGDAAARLAAGIVSVLRHRGICADFDVMGRSLKAQMKYADKLMARRVLIIGDSELESGRAVLKNMETGDQTEILLESAGDIITDIITA